MRVEERFGRGSPAPPIDLRGVVNDDPPIEGRGRAARGVDILLVDLPSVDLPRAAFSGDADRLGVVGVASTSRFCASSFAVIPRYLEARDPAVIPLAIPSDEAEVEENDRSLRVVGRAVIFERGRKRPHNGGQAKYCVLSEYHASGPYPPKRNWKRTL